MSDSTDNILNRKMMLMSDNQLKDWWTNPSLEIRELKDDDRLFVAAEDYRTNAHLDWYDDLTDLCISGYKEAGDALVDLVADRSRTANSLIFPVAFLYRHYLELRLKSVLYYSYRLLGRKYKQEREHNLSKLWSKVRDILIERWPNDKGELVAFDNLMDQFEKIDPRSTTFRYPSDFGENNSLKSEYPIINLGNLKEVIGAMAMILDGSAITLSEDQASKNDMQSDCW
jgi:hypothetical protein